MSVPPIGGAVAGAVAPRLQVVSAWNDPTDRTVWSGTVAGLLDELGRLGALSRSGYRDVTPWQPAVSVVRAWMSVTGRLSSNWALRPEMRALTAVRAATARWARPDGVDGWLLPMGSLGRPVRHPYATWCDMAPTQIAVFHPRFPDSYGFGGLGARDMAAFVRQQADVLRRADVCLAVSHWAASALVSSDGVAASRVHVTGAGSNVEVTPPSHRSWDVPRFLFVGNDWERKNGPAMVRCFNSLRAERPDAELHVVGRGIPRIDAPGVRVHGPLSFTVPDEHRRLEELFHRATCLVMPSQVEAFGIVHVEAGASGIPSIGTMVGGAATAIGPGGTVVDPDSDAALMDALRRLAEPAVAADLGGKARDWSAQFTWRRCAERVVRAFAPGYADSMGLADFL